MSALTNVFAKVFIREFYRLNAGFFMVVITLTFGFMSGREHKALAEFFVASPLLSLIPISVWLVYAAKVILFNKQRLQLAENVFLFNTSITSFTQQTVCASQTLFIQLIPTALYGLFLCVMALRNGFYQSLITIIAGMVVLQVFSTLILVRSLRTPIREFKTSVFKRFIDKHTVRPLWWIYIVTVLRQEPFLFVGTKIFTGLLLFAVTQLYIGETYDARLLAMAATFAGIGNYMVMMQLQLFDFRSFILMKGLPLGILRRWATLVSITLVFVLPELIIVIKYAPSISTIDLLSTLMLIPSLALTVYSLLYLKFKNQETLGRLTFGIAMVHVVLILFKIPVVAFVIVNLTLAWMIFRWRYYKFELPASKE